MSLVPDSSRLIETNRPVYIGSGSPDTTSGNEQRQAGDGPSLRFQVQAFFVDVRGSFVLTEIWLMKIKCPITMALIDFCKNAFGKIVINSLNSATHLPGMSKAL